MPMLRWSLPKSAMAVELQVATGLQHTSALTTEAALSGWLQQIQVTLRDARLERDICVRVCDATESAQLNEQYRGKAHPTNVLSFPSGSDLAQIPLGDLAICAPVVIEEAQAQDKSIQDHLTHLFVHGVLHLLGFDHECEAQAQSMEALEVRILANMGISDPYQV